MERLTPEELARLVDEPATDEERRLLEESESSAAELAELREMVVALGELPDVRPPRGDWQVLEARLMSEGLVHNERGIRSRLARTPGWMQAAAAVILFASGAGLGVSLDPRGQGATLAQRTGGDLQMAAVDAAPTSVDEAAEAMQQAELAFVESVVRYRQVLEAESGDRELVDPESRYAALEYWVAAAEAAVREAPADPFMNGLLASVRAERQAARAAALQRASQAQDWY